MTDHLIKFLFLPFIFLFFLSFVAKADMLDQLEDQIEARGDISSGDIAELSQLIRERSIGTDLMLQTLLMTPFEKRQYIFPALHESPLIAKKIRTHPEIIIWKGTKPTTIPEPLKEFAKVYLDDLPAAYYPLLDPVYWSENKEDQRQTLNLDQPGLVLSTHMEEFFSYPEVQSFYHLTPDQVKNFKKTDLTETDVDRLGQTLNNIKNYYNSIEEPAQLQQKLRNLMTDRVQLRLNLADPFKGLVNRFEKLGKKEDLERLIQQAGWKSTDEFVQKSDRILKAYRARKLTPVIAIELNKLRKQTPYSEGEPMTNIQMYLRLYEAPSGDIYFTEPFEDQLKEMFESPNYTVLGMPIYLD